MITRNKLIDRRAKKFTTEAQGTPTKAFSPGSCFSSEFFVAQPLIVSESLKGFEVLALVNDINERYMR